MLPLVNFVDTHLIENFIEFTTCFFVVMDSDIADQIRRSSILYVFTVKQFITINAQLLMPDGCFLTAFDCGARQPTAP